MKNPDASKAEILGIIKVSADAIPELQALKARLEMDISIVDEMLSAVVKNGDVFLFYATNVVDPKGELIPGVSIIGMDEFLAEASGGFQVVTNKEPTWLSAPCKTLLIDSTVPFTDPDGNLME